MPLHQRTCVLRVSSDSPLGVDEVFLGSCREFEKRGLNEDEDVSDAERLSASYLNATYDFHGTPSGALCVYKNGDAWPVRTGPESQRIIREARPVYDHPIKAAWRICTLSMIRRSSGRQSTPSLSQRQGRRRSVLLLWIGVEPASILYEDANTVAEAVTFLLAEAGFKGIEIGFRCSASTPSLTPSPSSASLSLPLSASPSLPHFEGTGALYLRESKESDRVFLLTCAHVARPPPAHGNTGLSRKTQSNPRKQVIAPGNMGYTNAVQNMMVTIGDQERSTRHWEGVLRRLGEPDEDEGKKITKKRKEYLALRIIGEVVHVEPIAVAAEPHRYTRDRALIELYNDKFDWDAFKGNKVYVGDNISSSDYGKIIFPHPEDQVDYTYLQDGLLQAFGVVQAHEIYNPQHLDANGEKCLLVVKNGLTTGTTIGRVTRMQSFTRVYNEYGIEETSIEIAVLPYGNTNEPFSAPGDSGSIVLTRDSHILGMLTGGASTTERTDVTYITLYCYIEEGIKVFPRYHLYEVVDRVDRR
ncbi:hypothetical protein C8Q79DRAFT_924166 [Trametes meyenii]|nr:hypothetical protein C8Q79DRAFT_924166 [Trametes meyenii]